MSRKRSSANKKVNRKAAYLIVLIIFFLVYMFVQGDHGFFRYLELKKERKHLLLNIEALKKEKASLEKEIGLLQNSNDYIEKIAREEHLMSKEGETVYKIKKSDQ
ncbi:MAG: septum formation initiator family protein [candidate division KSB1 bacterium]|jgi:cell division protein FtsB|nr:septum formation initiator family protein [candidate division KSB1 bacterium]